MKYESTFAAAAALLLLALFAVEGWSFRWRMTRRKLGLQTSVSVNVAFHSVGSGPFKDAAGVVPFARHQVGVRNVNVSAGDTSMPTKAWHLPDIPSTPRPNFHSVGLARNLTWSAVEVLVVKRDCRRRVPIQWLNGSHLRSLAATCAVAPFHVVYTAEVAARMDEIDAMNAVVRRLVTDPPRWWRWHLHCRVLGSHVAFFDDERMPGFCALWTSVRWGPQTPIEVGSDRPSPSPATSVRLCGVNSIFRPLRNTTDDDRPAFPFRFVPSANGHYSVDDEAPYVLASSATDPPMLTLRTYKTHEAFVPSAFHLRPTVDGTCALLPCTSSRSLVTLFHGMARANRPSDGRSYLRPFLLTGDSMMRQTFHRLVAQLRYGGGDHFPLHRLFTRAGSNRPAWDASDHCSWNASPIPILEGINSHEDQVYVFRRFGDQLILVPTPTVAAGRESPPVDPCHTRKHPLGECLFWIYFRWHHNDAEWSASEIMGALLRWSDPYPANESRNEPRHRPWLHWHSINYHTVSTATSHFRKQLLSVEAMRKATAEWYAFVERLALEGGREWRVPYRYVQLTTPGRSKTVRYLVTVRQDETDKCLSRLQQQSPAVGPGVAHHPLTSFQSFDYSALTGKCPAALRQRVDRRLGSHFTCALGTDSGVYCRDDVNAALLHSLVTALAAEQG